MECEGNEPRDRPTRGGPIELKKASPLDSTGQIMPKPFEDASPRHVLPNDLPNAIRHLGDEELDRLLAATLSEMSRRGRATSDRQALAAAKPGRSLVDSWSVECRSSRLQGRHHTFPDCSPVRNISIGREEGPGVRRQSTRNRLKTRGRAKVKRADLARLALKRLCTSLLPLNRSWKGVTHAACLQGYNNLMNALY
jgi:hypothetical protein